MAGVEVTKSIRDGAGTLFTVRLWSEASDGSGPFSFVNWFKDISNGEYEVVLASATDQVLGPTGAVGDYLAGVLIVPGTTSPGAVTIKDGSSSPDVSITLFTGGGSSVSNLVPFFVPLGIKSTVGSWRVTTGSNVSVLASGNFT